VKFLFSATANTYFSCVIVIGGVFTTKIRKTDSFLIIFSF